MRVPIKLPPPNRLAVYLTSTAALLAALAPAVANLDTQSTIGLLGGLLGLVGIVRKWLEGWQKHEERSAPAGGADGGSGGLSPERVAAVREAASAATSAAVDDVQVDVQWQLEGPPPLNAPAAVPDGEPVA